MARQKPQRLERTQKTSSTLLFNNRAGYPMNIGSILEENVAEYATRNGYMFQQTLTLFDYDFTIFSPAFNAQISLLFDTLNKKYGSRMTVKKEEFQTYLEYLYILTQQTAFLGRILAVYGNQDEDTKYIEQFRAIFGTLALGNTNDDKYATYLDGSTSNPLTDGTLYLYSSQSIDTFNRLVFQLNQMPDPLGFKEKLWNSIRYFYKDQLDSDLGFIGLVPKMYPFLHIDDHDLTAQVAETWSVLSGAEFPVYFETLYTQLSASPTWFSDVMKAIDRLEFDRSFIIPNELETLFKQDEALSTSVHNAKLGRYFSRSPIVGTDMILMNDGKIHVDYMNNSAIAQLNNEDGDKSTLIDKAISDVSDYDYVRFADIWYQAHLDKSCAGFEGLTCSLHLYLNSPSENGVSALLSTGTISLTINDDALHSSLEATKGLLAHILMLLQMKSAPLTQIKYRAFNSSTRVGWDTWMWRSSRIAKIQENLFDSIIDNYVQDIFNGIRVLNK